MQYAFERAEGFVMITGKAGTGKTTLVNDMIDNLPKSKVKVATLVSTQLDADDLLRMSAFSFGLDAKVTHKATILQELAKLLISNHRKGQRALLIVDEAQDLSVSSLEELRLLTNLQLHNHQLVQIFLLGQEGLAELIQKPEMEQVHQRLIAAHCLEALSSEDTKAYIKHRLTKAGWQGDPAISNAVYSIIFQASGGIPRRVNSICNRLFLHGSVEQRHQLGVLDVKTVLEELEQEGLAGEVRSTGIDFNETDTYDLDDSKVKGLDKEQKKNTFNLQPDNNRDTQHVDRDKHQSFEPGEGSTLFNVKDTWISSASDAATQAMPPDDTNETPDPQARTIVDALEEFPEINLAAQTTEESTVQTEPGTTPVRPVNKPGVKTFGARRSLIFTSIGFLSLVAGLLLLLILIWKPNLELAPQLIGRSNPINLNNDSSHRQKIERNIDVGAEQTLSSNNPPADSDTRPAKSNSVEASADLLSPAISPQTTPSQQTIPTVNNTSPLQSTSESTQNSAISASDSKPHAIIKFEFDKFYIEPKFQRDLDTVSEHMKVLEKKKRLLSGIRTASEILVTILISPNNARLPWRPTLPVVG